MDFKIVDVFTQDGQLVVRAEHYHPTDAASVWFVEHYTWQGREGLKQKRATNALGQLLLDDGTVAPVEVQPGPPDKLVPFLPAGRDWLRQPAPHMVDDTILATIRSVHRQRRASGWPTTTDRLPSFKFSPADALSVETLRLKFQGLIGRQE
jgi:hypothetical protein